MLQQNVWRHLSVTDGRQKRVEDVGDPTDAERQVAEGREGGEVEEERGDCRVCVAASR